MVSCPLSSLAVVTLDSNDCSDGSISPVGTVTVPPGDALRGKLFGWEAVDNGGGFSTDAFCWKLEKSLDSIVIERADGSPLPPCACASGCCERG